MPSNRGANLRETPSAPVRFATRSDAGSPDWSRTVRICRRPGRTRAWTPCFRRSAAARRARFRVVSRPRARTARRADGTGTRTGGPPEFPRVAARTAAARAAPSGTEAAWAPYSLWAIRIARTGSSYGAAANTAGSPAGAGSGRTSRGGRRRCARQAGQTVVPGPPQPAQRAGSTRSSHVVASRRSGRGRGRRSEWIPERSPGEISCRMAPRCGTACRSSGFSAIRHSDTSRSGIGVARLFDRRRPAPRRSDGPMPRRPRRRDDPGAQEGRGWGRRRCP